MERLLWSVASIAAAVALFLFFGWSALFVWFAGQVFGRARKL